MRDMDEIEKELENVLKKKRYQHTIGVKYTAQAMAMKYGADITKAGYAGVLHDCAKNMSDSEQLMLAQKHQMVCSDVERKQPFLLHAVNGAILARTQYKVSDEDILSAIRWHTTGKPEMTVLEKIIYIADYIEPNRKTLPGMDEIRRTAFEDLDQTMYLILKNTIEYIKQSETKEIEEHTMAAYAYYKTIVEAKKG